MEDLLKACTGMVNLPPLGLSNPLYPWIFWVLWTSRNQLLFEDKSFSEADMVLKAIKNAKEWQSATQKPEKPTASPKDSNSPTNLSHTTVTASPLLRCGLEQFQLCWWFGMGDKKLIREHHPSRKLNKKICGFSTCCRSSGFKRRTLKGYFGWTKRHCLFIRLSMSNPIAHRKQVCDCPQRDLP